MAIPDADIHTSATGRAAKIVAAHQDPAPLTLYSGWFCPFVQRVWSVLEEKGIPYQYVEVNPYHKPESLLKINPRGLVPTLEYEGKPLYESSVVLEFIEDVYGDTGKRLRSEDPVERARGRERAKRRFLSVGLSRAARMAALGRRIAGADTHG